MAHKTTQVNQDPNEAPGKVTILLSRAALERLIAGDSEMEFKLRQMAIQEIVKRHLLGSLSLDGMAELQKSISDHLVWLKKLTKEAVDAVAAEALGKLVKQWPCSSTKLEFNNETLEQIRRHVATALSNAIEENVQICLRPMQEAAATVRQRLGERLQALDATFTTIVEQRLGDIADTKIQAEVERRLKLAAQLPPPDPPRTRVVALSSVPPGRA